MKWLTEDAHLICDHRLGNVAIQPSQSLVTIQGRKVLVEQDPEKKGISSCPNVGFAIKPCALTLPVEKGYSVLIRINGRRVCLDIVTGKTDGTPPGLVYYHVKDAGQKLVEEE